MTRAICIKGYEDMKKGDIVNAWQGFNGNMLYHRGFKVKLSIPPSQFNEHFIAFRDYYIIQKLGIKRRFRKQKNEYVRVEFKNAPDYVLVELYNCVFSYLELIKRKNPELIESFNYSIITTLEKLEHLYTIVPTNRFIEAVKHSEQVFKGIYKTALSIEIELLPKAEDYNQLLESFKMDNNILGNFFKELNGK